MTAGGQKYFFRVKENGTVVSRIDPESPTRRIEMTQIAVINVKNGEIRPQGDRVLGDEDRRAVEEWLENAVETEDFTAAVADYLDRGAAIAAPTP